MYKVSKDRNVFREINFQVSSIGTGMAIINSIGLRSWFDVTKPLNELLKIDKKIDNNNIYKLKEYFQTKYKQGKFPERPTNSYLANQSGFSEDTIKRSLNGERGGSRDFIISMCFAFKLNIIESNLLLKSYGYNELYDKDLRDIIIIKSIYDNFINKDYTQGKIPIHELNTTLEDNGLDEISSLTSKRRKK
ncbi:hypothetical protein HF875_08010 [Paraclostridium bifermentans]|uniref:Uncharacterized protein n=1 Tax=Paraclostridium bifermentans TaxID=1490 RepID=A0AA44IH44_PARBF|nr:hypothetical protein [Paraclostridium bifermentans]NME09461.1 hypothetical protein [Paraclostridium bifermentans]